MKIALQKLLPLLAVLASAMPAAVDAAALPSVVLPQATYLGKPTSVAGASATSLQQFLGIPYAPQPTRFSRAIAIPAGSATVTATTYRADCPEAVATNQPFFKNPNPNIGEDCLVVNVYKPVTSSTTRKAVMVWFYGGGLQFGGIGQDLYDGSMLAVNNDVIVVTVNYRLNIFGFPNAPSQFVTSANHNLGFWDQRLAIDWIYANVAAFGGDPARITIFGESSGSASVDRLVNIPPRDTNGALKIQAAIYQSGQASIAYGFSGDSGTQKTGDWDTVAKSVNCGSTENAAQYTCMQQADFRSIINAILTNNLTFRPINDETTQKRTPVINNGDANSNLQYTFTGRAQIPLLIGQNGKEGSLLPTVNRETNSGTFDYETALLTDSIFKCAAERVVKASYGNNNQNPGLPVYRFLYNATFADIVDIIGGPPPGISYEQVGAYHTSEIRLVFGSLLSTATNNEKTLSRYMQQAWGGFAKHPTTGPFSDWVPQTTGKNSPQSSQQINCLGCLNNPTGLSFVGESTLDGNCPFNFNNGYNANIPNA